MCPGWTTDWLAGRSDSNLPHSGIEIRQVPAWGLRDLNLCILKLDLLNFMSPQRDVGVDRAPNSTPSTAYGLERPNRVASLKPPKLQMI